MLSFRRRESAVTVAQATFSFKGGLVVQTSLSVYLSETETVVRQATLDQWLCSSESTLSKNGNKSNTKSARNVSFEDWDDNWDGSVNNQEKIRM